MTEFRHPQQEQQEFRFRLLIAGVVVVLMFAILVGRLLWLQVFHYDNYSAQAEENRITIVPIVPNRGLILDRNLNVMANNYSAYTLEITPSKIKQLDKTLDELAQVVEITALDRRRFKKLKQESKRFESIPIRTRLTDEEVAKFAVQSYRFPGIEIKARLFRQYPHGEVAAHALGYIGRISQKDQDLIDDQELTNNYRGTVYIGKDGIEKYYETTLHGKTGFEEVETSAGGRAVRVLSRSPSVPGDNLVLAMDSRLQLAAEDALSGKRGALVALDPNTGDVLAYVSRPSFDPNLFVEGIDPDNWKLLNESPDRPLLNRPLAGAYPPGSTFKPFMSMIALEKGVRNMNSGIRDAGYFDFGGRRFMDDKIGGHGYVDMFTSISVSCNTFYYILGNDMGIDMIAENMAKFGFGQLTGIDLGGERTGVLPSKEWKNKTFKRPELRKWYSGETISVAIGQGYNAYTPLQLAHAVGVLSTGGQRVKPRMVRAVQNPVTGEITERAVQADAPLNLKPEHVDFIKRAMQGVTLGGTASRVFAGAKYTVGGKTGTAQVFSLKKGETYKSKELAERFRDHSWFVAFSPVDKPRIAIAVIVENGGFGAQAAAPAVKQVIDAFWSSTEFVGPPTPPNLKNRVN